MDDYRDKIRRQSKRYVLIDLLMFWTGVAIWAIAGIAMAFVVFW